MASERVALDVDASPVDVWHVAGDRWDEIARLVPSISASELVAGSTVEPGAVRRCELTEPTFGLAFVEERLTEWDPPRSFTYEMTDPRSRSVDSATGGRSRLIVVARG